MIMAEYGSRRSQLPANVNFEPIKRGLKNDNLTGTRCKIRFIYVRFNCKRQKVGQKMGGKLPLRGSIGGPMLARFLDPLACQKQVGQSDV